MLNHRNEENYTQELKSSSHREGQACSYLALYFFFFQKQPHKELRLSAAKKKKHNLQLAARGLKEGWEAFSEMWRGGGVWESRRYY